MNIFVLDRCPAKAARHLSDGHMVKMVLETAQIMSTVLHRYGLPTAYKPTHRNHPCVLWAGEARRHWTWLEAYAVSLCDEYCSRFSRSHGSAPVIHEAINSGVRYKMRPVWLGFTQAMPEQYRGPDAVEAYRRYYAAEKVWQKRKDGKLVRLARWERGTPTPEWWPHQVSAAPQTPRPADSTPQPGTHRSSG